MPPPYAQAVTSSFLAALVTNQVSPAAKPAERGEHSADPDSFLAALVTNQVSPCAETCGAANSAKPTRSSLRSSLTRFRLRRNLRSREFGAFLAVVKTCRHCH